MEINTFIPLFRDKIDNFLDNDYIQPSKNEDEYNPGDWTFLLNCIVFDVVREYRAKDKHIALCAEPEVKKTPTGRGGYGDLLICSDERDKEHIMIELENFPLGKLEKLVRKLSKSKAKQKLLVTYYFQDYTKRQIIKDLQRLVNKHFKKGSSLHLLISKGDTEEGANYKYEKIHCTRR